MRFTRFGVALAAANVAAAMSACSAPSLNRLYAKDKVDVVSEPGIVGTWQEDDRTYTVTADMNKSYRVGVAWKDKPDRAATLEVHLVRIGDAVFADIAPGEGDRDELAERFGATVLPAHVIARIELAGDGLHVWQADNQELTKRLAAGNASFAVYGEETTVLTGTPEQVKAAITAAAASPEVFKHKVTLTRVAGK